jgi:hypothetical protein
MLKLEAMQKIIDMLFIWKQGTVSEKAAARTEEKSRKSDLLEIRSIRT